jgi:hypothetical protein
MMRTELRLSGAALRGFEGVTGGRLTPPGGRPTRAADSPGPHLARRTAVAASRSVKLSSP